MTVSNQGEPQGRVASIEDLPFTDLYIRLDDFVPSRFRADPTRISNLNGNIQVPRRFNAEMERIKDLVLDQDAEDGTVTYKGYRLRYVRFIAEANEVWAALRGFPLDLPSLEDLRMNPAFVRALRGWGQRKGLIVIGGKTSEGKTTTCVAAIKDYLERLGGFAYTVEDPPEYQMQGAISEKGFCLQVEIKDDSKWYEAVKKAMRTRPDILFLGEIRTAEAAENLLKAVTSGHLVLTTVHAGSLQDTISAILQLAETRMGTKTARSVLSERLVAAVHQTLSKNGPTLTVLEPRREAANEQITSILLDGDLSKLGEHATRYEPNKQEPNKTS